MDESRKAFERFLREEHLYTDEELVWEDDRNCYSIYPVHIAWKSWQASREAIEIELPPVCDAHSDDIDKGYDICHYRTQECLKKQGIKFKIEGAERWSKISTPLESK